MISRKNACIVLLFVGYATVGFASELRMSELKLIDDSINNLAWTGSFIEEVLGIDAELRNEKTGSVKLTKSSSSNSTKFSEKPCGPFLEPGDDKELNEESDGQDQIELSVIEEIMKKLGRPDNDIKAVKESIENQKKLEEAFSCDGTMLSSNVLNDYVGKKKEKKVDPYEVYMETKEFVDIEDKEISLNNFPQNTPTGMFSSMAAVFTASWLTGAKK